MFNNKTRALLDILAINHNVSAFYYEEQGYSVLHNSHEIARIELDGKQYFSEQELMDRVSAIGYKAFRDVLCDKYKEEILTRKLDLLARNWFTTIDQYKMTSTHS